MTFLIVIKLSMMMELLPPFFQPISRAEFNPAIGLMGQSKRAIDEVGHLSCFTKYTMASLFAPLEIFDICGSLLKFTGQTTQFLWETPWKNPKISLEN